ncbi:MAG: lysophospholipid acyltransferase family protein [Pseudolabrys sp.]
MGLWKRVGRQAWVQTAVGVTAAEYLRLVALTNRTVVEPRTVYDGLMQVMPIIIAAWHGQHFMIPFLRKPEHRFKTLISRHRDGNINAVIAEHFGIGAIRGSGDHGGEFHRKGAVSAFRAMLAALEDGFSVTLTADVPKVARVAGTGIVKLAQMSGRPIYPLAIANSRRVELNSWDRSALPLPFGRMAGVLGEPITVDAAAGPDDLERARRAVETNLNAATGRAYALVDRRTGANHG